MEVNTIEAVKQMGIEATVEKIENIKDIMGYGVISTPILVVDEVVKSV